MTGSITAWLDRLKNGDETAAEKLWTYFSPSLLKRIKPNCRGLRISDESDIVTTAFHQLIKAVEGNDACGITNRKEFWRLLRVVTKRKLGDSIRYENAKSRGGEYSIVSLSAATGDITTDYRLGSSTYAPEDSELTLTDRFQRMLSNMDREEYSEIIRLKVQGKSNGVIARELGFSLRTIQYLIGDIKQAWINAFNDDC